MRRLPYTYWQPSPCKPKEDTRVRFKTNINVEKFPRMNKKCSLQENIKID